LHGIIDRIVSLKIKKIASVTLPLAENIFYFDYPFLNPYAAR